LKINEPGKKSVLFGLRAHIRALTDFGPAWSVLC
jgi:hypothetical protein